MKKKLLAGLITGLAFCGFTHTASAATLTFDDIGVSGNYTPESNIGFTYNGFSFSLNTSVIDLSSNGSWAQTGPAYSGNYAALNNWHGDIIVTKDGGGIFSFQDLYIRSWYNSTNTSSASINGYLNNSSAGEVRFTMTNSWQNIQANFTAIDELHIKGGNNFLMDNITVNSTSTSPVPEPTTMLLFGTGVAGLAAVGRKKRS